MKPKSLILELMDDPRAGLITESGRRFFRSRRVHFRTIDVTAADLHGIWLGYQAPLPLLNWAGQPSYKEVRDFARASSERFLAFFYQVFEVVLARALARRDTAILRNPLFVSRSFFDTGVPEEAEHASVPKVLQQKILREYYSAKKRSSRYAIYYLTEYLETLTDDLRSELARFHDLWNLKDRRENASRALQSLPERSPASSAEDWLKIARSVVFQASRCHRLRLRRMHMARHGRSLVSLSEELALVLKDFESRQRAFESCEDSVLCALVQEFLTAQTQIEELYAASIDPFEERTAVKHACTEILSRLRPLRRTTAAYSLIPGEKHGAMSLNPVLRLWKEKPETEHPEARILSLEMNTRDSVDCMLDLAMLADPRLSSREVERGRIARAMRGKENLENLRIFILPGSCYPLREVHPLDFPEFRSRVIGESRSPVQLGAEETSVLTGAWYSKSQHSLYVTVGADNGRLLRILWNSERSPGPPAFFFALGQYVHDCLADGLIYRRTAGTTFRECLEDYYDFEDRIRKNRGEKTGRRRIDNSRTGVRFMFAVLYSRIVTEILTGSYQSHFRHPATEKWMEENAGLSRDREHLRAVRARLRSAIAARNHLDL